MTAILIAAQIATSQRELGFGREIADTTGWSGFVANEASYHWLTPTTFLYFTDGGGYRWKLHEFNIDSRMSRELKQLTRVFGESRSGLGDVLPSPNGKYLLWSGVQGKESDFILADLDGKMIGRWPRPLEGHYPSSVWEPELWTYAHWSPDSQTIFETELVPSGTVQVRARALGHVMQAQQLPPAHISVEFHPDFVAGNRALAVASGWGSSTTSCTFASWDPWKPSSISRWDYTAPKGSEILTESNSLDGKRMLWEYLYPRHKVRESGDTDNIARIEFWVTDMGGAHPLRVATIPFYAKSASDQYAHLSPPSWLPGGRQCSVIYYGRMYLLTVPPHG